MSETNGDDPIGGDFEKAVKHPPEDRLFDDFRGFSGGFIGFVKFVEELFDDFLRDDLFSMSEGGFFDGEIDECGAFCGEPKDAFFVGN